MICAFDVMPKNFQCTINNMIVAFCAHSIFRISSETTQPNSEPNFLTMQKPS